MNWTDKDKAWIFKMDELFSNLFEPDYCLYGYTETKHCEVESGQFPLKQYNHEKWEKEWNESNCGNISTAKAAPQDSGNTSTAKAAPQHSGNTSSATTGIASHDIGGNRELRLNNLSVLTHCERAALALPRVASILPKDVVLFQGQIEVRNPLLEHLHPSENVVQHAINLLREASTTKSGEGDDVDIEDKVAVTIGSLGTFTQESVQVFQTMCNLAKEAVKIREEEKWLAKGNDVLLDLTSVRDLLLNSRPNDEVLKQGMSIMDVSDFSALACERYVSGFTIDTVCLKFLEESKTTNIVYLPSFSQTWAKQGPGYFSQNVKQFFTHCAVEDAECIMTPVHFDMPQHWGLLCFDTASKTVYFDDGLKLSPPRGTRTVIKNMSGSFELLSNHVGFQEVNWNQHNLIAHYHASTCRSKPRVERVLRAVALV